MVEYGATVRNVNPINGLRRNLYKLLKVWLWLMDLPEETSNHEVTVLVSQRGMTVS